MKTTIKMYMGVLKSTEKLVNMQLELHQQRVLEYLLWEKFYFHYMMRGRE